MHKRTFTISIILVSFFLSGCDPTISYNTALGLLNGGRVMVQGSYFTSSSIPIDQHYLVLRDPSGSETVINRTDPLIAEWDGKHVEFTMPVPVTNAYTVRIVVGAKTSSNAPIEFYQYDFVDTPSSAGNLLPLDLSWDNNDGKWLVSEFSGGITYFPAVGSPTYYLAPVPTVNPIFCLDLGPPYNVFPTNMSSLGEKIFIDDNDAVWFTQGGGLLCNEYYNASRVVRFDPATNQWSCFNIPIDNAEAFGLHQTSDGRMWVSTSGYESGDDTVLVSFDPTEFSAAETPCDYDFTIAPPIQICANISDTHCFRAYTDPLGHFSSGHIEEDESGNIWTTRFLDHIITRLNPTTGVIDSFPLPATSRPLPPDWPEEVSYGPGPWQLTMIGTDLYFVEFFHGSISRFDLTKLASNDCTILNAYGLNPCITRYPIPYFQPYEGWPHSLYQDTIGRLWFSVHGDVRLAQTKEGAVGRMWLDTKTLQLFPDLSTLSPPVFGGATGIITDDTGNNIWFSEIANKRIGHLQKIY